MLVWGGAGRGSLGSSQPECGQATRLEARPLSLLRHRLEAEFRALGWAGGEAPAPLSHAGLLLWRTQGRELKGLGSGRARPSQKDSTLPRALGTRPDVTWPRPPGGGGRRLRTERPRPVDLLSSGQPPLPPMGNSHCVPQAPRRLRASFSRKPSLKGNREDGTRKLAGLFGTEASPDAGTAAGKIFYYVPGTVSGGRVRRRRSVSAQLGAPRSFPGSIPEQGEEVGRAPPWERIGLEV